MRGGGPVNSARGRDPDWVRFSVARLDVNALNRAHAD